VSFLDRIASAAPKTAADVLIDAINLTFHPTLMGNAGESAVAVAEQAYEQGNFILVVEGGIPTAFGGACCWAWEVGGQKVTFQQAVQRYSARALKIICAGTCAGWGGMSAAPPNPCGVVGVQSATGRSTINVAGCPPHPDWIVWVISQLLIGAAITVDSYGRPTTLYPRTIHSVCPRRSAEDGDWGQDGRCLEELGCRGPSTYSTCSTSLFNGATNWCIGANAPCIGCTQPTFPGSNAFFREYKG
jgi:hydrogenase small subunit